MKKLTSNGAIIGAMILGIIVGGLMGEKATIFAPLGNLFLKLITMLVIPLVFFSIISGAASLGKTKSAGKVGFFTLAYYLITSAFSVLIGIGAGFLFKPGLGVIVPESLLTDSSTYTASSKVVGFWDTIIGIVPSNPFESLITGNILQILVFSLFFGICLASLDDKKQKPVLDIRNTINDVVIKMVEKILLLAPLGVFGLMANSIAVFGIDILTLVLKLFIVFTIALSTIHFGMIPGLVTLFTGINPLKFLKTLAPAQILAFSTASSMATLPINTKCCEELGVDSTTASFVLPLGATINMNGNAMLYGLIAMFFAQMFGIEIGVSQFIAIVLTSVLGAVGTAGVPVIALPLVFGIDRILDMMRTSTNTLGDASCAVIMDNIIKKENKKAVVS